MNKITSNRVRRQKPLKHLIYSSLLWITQWKSLFLPLGCPPLVRHGARPARTRPLIDTWKKSSLTEPAAGQPGKLVHLDNLRFSRMPRTGDRFVRSGRQFIPAC